MTRSMISLQLWQTTTVSAEQFKPKGSDITFRVKTGNFSIEMLQFYSLQGKTQCSPIMCTTGVDVG